MQPEFASEDFSFLALWVVMVDILRIIIRGVP